jgi:hypothetical protein
MPDYTSATIRPYLSPKATQLNALENPAIWIAPVNLPTTVGM